VAYSQAGRLAEAQEDFQSILGSNTHGPDFLVVAAQLELGRVYQKQGDTAKARIAYQNFLAAWKDALRRVLTDDKLHARLVQEATTRPLPTWKEAAQALRSALTG